ATTPSDAPEAAAVATDLPAVAAVEIGPPFSVGQQFGDRWAAGDYGGIYDLLTAGAQKAAGRQAFADRYAAIATEAGLTAVGVRATGAANLQTQVPIRVVFTSSKVGQVTEENTVQLRREGDAWKIDWTPSLIFKNLGGDCIAYHAAAMSRGSILDRNGDPLAYDGTVNVLGIIPGQIKDEAATLKTLAKITGMTAADIKDRYKNGQPDWFMPIKQFPEQMDQQLLNGIGTVADNGVAVRTETARLYPLGAKAAHITGYVTKVTAEDLAADKTGRLAADQRVGRAGLEAGANDLLSGQPGGTLAVVDCGSRTEKSVIAEKKAVPAQNLILTIDKAFQTAVDAALGDVSGSAVILDPRNGSVLALASHPSYDPAWFVSGFAAKDLAYVNDEAKRPLLDRATEAGYPTGSIFKVITMAAGMEALGYTGETPFDCPQQWSIPGTDTVFRDWTAEEGVGAQGALTLHQALVNSCNTIFYQIGNALDEKDDTLLPNMAKSFGLGSPTGIPYLPEIGGIVPDPTWKRKTVGDYWARGDAINLSIGQGYLEATPLQMAVAYTAIANKGAVLQPYIVEFTQTPDGTMTRVGKRTAKKLAVGKATIAEIQSALRDQTSDPNGAGSVRVFGDMAWPIAGKTGTAQNQLNVAEKPHSWFAAFGPYGATATISSIVMVESSGEGVLFAAPRTRQIYDYYLTTKLADETNKKP
ncbi:MAG: penicillin-binding transpeptidase domain-containing protein, partial [Thermomicrobiales bacterium]